jgi:hypothetical protein
VIVMPSNNTGFTCGYLAGKYGNVGHLFGPGGYRRTHKSVPFAIDNGRFAYWGNPGEWPEDAFLGLLEKVRDSRRSPMWVVVPDVVGDKDGTLLDWDAWSTDIARMGFRLAFAAQDGMTPDVPDDAETVFLGGSTKWKRKSLWPWCEAFPGQIHVGRVNTGKWLWECYRAGAVSCDGTGWFRGDPQQLVDLESFLERMHREGGDPQGHLFQDTRPCIHCAHPITPSYARCGACNKHSPPPPRLHYEVEGR